MTQHFLSSKIRNALVPSTMTLRRQRSRMRMNDAKAKHALLPFVVCALIILVFDRYEIMSTYWTTKRNLVNSRVVLTYIRACTCRSMYDSYM